MTMMTAKKVLITNTRRILMGAVVGDDDVNVDYDGDDDKNSDENYVDVGVDDSSERNPLRKKKEGGRRSAGWAR